MTKLWAQRGGADGPLLVLLHGMGHTAEVWRGLIDVLGGHGWLAIDLPGHGRSPWTAPYSFDSMATAVAAVLPAGRPVLAALTARAAKPPRVFATLDEALDAFLRFGGLDGVVPPDSALARSGVTATDGGYRLPTDPQTMAIGAPDMPALLATASPRAHVVLARGEHDHMVSAEQLHAVDPGAIKLPGVGHNVHVTHPRALRELVDSVGGAGR